MVKQFQPEVQWLPVEKIVPYALNNKKHPQRQIDSIASSIAQFGWDVPIVVDEDSIILKGHGRYLAALKLSLTRVPVIVRSDLTPTEKRAARIADNKTAISDWDEEPLKLELEWLKEANFDLELTGFSLEECSQLFTFGTLDFDGSVFGEDGDARNTSGKTPSDGSLLALSSIAIAEPQHKVEAGDIWRLDAHVLVVADVLTQWDKYISFLEGDVIFATDTCFTSK